MRSGWVEKHAVGPVTLFALFILFSAVSFSPVYAVTPHQADSIWVEPPEVDYSSSTAVGTRFNITVWLNVTSLSNSWQFYLTYDTLYLQALRGNYTGNGKSLWSGNSTVDTVEPVFGAHNATHNYILHSETLRSGLNRTGDGALSWVEFNITRVPPAGTTITTELRLDISGIFQTQVMDSTSQAPHLIPLSYGKCLYVIPEFPFTLLLFASIALASGTALLFQKKTQRRISTRRSSRI